MELYSPSPAMISVVLRARTHGHDPARDTYSTHEYGTQEVARCRHCGSLGGYDHGSASGWGWDTPCPGQQ